MASAAALVMLRIPQKLEPYRRDHPLCGRGDRSNGMFFIPHMRLVIIASAGGGWEHVSVSHANRCPTWDEMEFVKRLFWEPDDVVMQLHVSERHHINVHRFCLHLWRPLNAEIPLPPKEFVA